MAHAVRCVATTKRFGSFTAVRDLDLELHEGSVLGFLGPNGAGKSTTIRMLLGLSAPTSGTVRVLGADPLRDRRVRARVGYAPGELRLDDRLTVATTLESWGRLRGAIDRTYRDELVERLGVTTDRPVRSLSTGNRRKLALVGAMMSRPDLLVLDEPTNGLDPLVQSEFLRVLAEAAERGTTVLLSSHILSEVERVADEVVVIREGVVVAQGPTDRLRASASRSFHAVFADAVPDADVLAALPGAESVERHGERSLHVRWTGPPTPLLRELARHELASLTAPEPDLETAFLSYYRGAASVDARGGAA